VVGSAARATAGGLSWLNERPDDRKLIAKMPEMRKVLIILIPPVMQAVSLSIAELIDLCFG
jgi:hypothetical protein